jgi:RimJ/RimL family protein N-acetyltransferase
MEILVTRRLTLRPPIELDADDIAAHLANWNVSRMLSRVPFPFDRIDAIEWIRRCNHPGNQDIAFTIHRERLIGAVAIADLPGQPRLGYWLAEDHWGQGLMGEALGAVLGHFLQSRPESVVHSTILADNTASIRLQQRLGFRIVGAGESFSTARQALVPAVRTELARADFRGLAGKVYDVAA